MADLARTTTSSKSGDPAGKSPEADPTRRAILGRLRGALARADLRFPPADPPELTAATRMAVTDARGGVPELAARFAAEVESLHGTCSFVGSPAEARLAVINCLLDWRNEDDANQKGMRVQTGQERMVLGWESGALPVEHVAESLADMGMHLVVPSSLTSKESREAVRHIRYGLTGVEAAFAATGSLLLAASPQTLRAPSLLPFRHIALVPITRLFANVEAWLAEMRLGDLAAWLRSKPNVTLITGPSKSADIEMILTLGVHGPKHLHVILFDDGVKDDEAHDAFWRYVPGGPPPEPDAGYETEADDDVLPAQFRNRPAELTPIEPAPETQNAPDVAPSEPNIDPSEPSTDTPNQSSIDQQG